MLELFNSKNLYSQNAKKNLDDNSQLYRVVDQDEEDLFWTDRVRMNWSDSVFHILSYIYIHWHINPDI